MHPRSIYRGGHPDFDTLGEKYPQLAVYLERDSRGRTRIDFKNKAALRTLTRVLLLDDFGLDVTFPEDSLVPTIPLRLNYILWVEDLLSFVNPDVPCSREVVHGIDIGTGASTVYALLAARKNGWNMVGTESNLESVGFAVANVKRNNLEGIIRIQHTTDESILKGVLLRTGDFVYSFCMCNPPFFASVQDSDSCSKKRKQDRPQPSGARTGSNCELIVEGGELMFIRRMITESKELYNKVRIFTTMVGVKKHLKPLVQELKCASVMDYTTAEFTQGKTLRWGLAWTFYENIKFEKNVKTKPKNHPPLTLIFPRSPALPDIFVVAKNLLLSLELTLVNETSVSLEALANRNTWSHQRRKRREQSRMIANGEVSSAKVRRAELSDGTELQNLQPPITSGQDCNRTIEDTVDNKSESSQVSNTEQEIGLRFNLQVSCENSDWKIQLEYLDGGFGREGLNQIHQYLKNKILQQAVR